MATWDHKGTEISLSDRGDFTATDCNGKFTRTASLDAMKKKLDAMVRSAFKPFQALDLSFYSQDWKPGKGVSVVNVTEIEKAKGGRVRHDTAYFVGKVVGASDRYNNNVRSSKLYPDTQECRDAYNKYMQLTTTNNKLRDKMKRAESAAEKAIPTLIASAYNAKVTP